MSFSSYLGFGRAGGGGGGDSERIVAQPAYEGLGLGFHLGQLKNVSFPNFLCDIAIT